MKTIDGRKWFEESDFPDYTVVAVRYEKDVGNKLILTSENTGSAGGKKTLGSIEAYCTDEVLHKYYMSKNVHYCDCGNLATRKSGSHHCCERCKEIEGRMKDYIPTQSK